MPAPFRIIRPYISGSMCQSTDCSNHGNGGEAVDSLMADIEAEESDGQRAGEVAAAEHTGNNYIQYSPTSPPPSESATDGNTFLVGQVAAADHTGLNNDIQYSPTSPPPSELATDGDTLTIRGFTIPGSPSTTISTENSDAQSEATAPVNHVSDSESEYSTDEDEYNPAPIPLLKYKIWDTDCGMSIVVFMHHIMYDYVELDHHGVLTNSGKRRYTLRAFRRIPKGPIRVQLVGFCYLNLSEKFRVPHLYNRGQNRYAVILGIQYEGERGVCVWNDYKYYR